MKATKTVRSRRLASIFILCLATIPLGALPAPSEPGQRHGPWLGEVAPGDAPALFAPGFVSTGMYERDTAWTPDGREVYWTVLAPLTRRGTIVAAKLGDDGSWNEPYVPPIFRGSSCLEPCVSADGRWLWFASNRPLPGESDLGDWNLWRAPREGDHWDRPEVLPAPLNLDGDEFYPSLTRDGTVYFTAEREGGLGGEDIWRSSPSVDGWEEAENLGPAVNSAGPEFNALVHPEGLWIVFGSARSGDHGGGDLYISRRTNAGDWEAAVVLAEPLNSSALDFCPALSPDGRYLFFSSRRERLGRTLPGDYAALANALLGPGNGQSDIYWVEVSALQTSTTPAAGSASPE
jgi:hypothetical protein